MTGNSTPESTPAQTPSGGSSGDKAARRIVHHTGKTSLWLRLRRRLMRLLGDVLFTWTTCRINANHTERLPRTGPVVMIFNHVTGLDPIFAGIAIRDRDNVPIGKIELVKNLFHRLLLAMWGVILIRRGEMDMTALRRCLAVLESDDFLSIAPEGTRSFGGLREPKDGFVMLAARSNAVIVPCGVAGALELPKNVRRLRRTPITVNYGRPLRLKGKISRQQYHDVADELMYQIAMLIPAELRGLYSDLSKATMTYIEYADAGAPQSAAEPAPSSART
ncbi:MAG: 1-acyl-sn-glycerol-3-phosphate acyltransferase [Anaerolineae bacterium]|nr:1-acyl-sn-glycerol-3-phosphate acyltransferase [Anaerolineae bacterium]